VKKHPDEEIALFFDTETSGLPKYKLDYKHNQPWVVQLGAILSSNDMIYGQLDFMIRSNGRKIEDGAYKTHHIKNKYTDDYGIDEITACLAFMDFVVSCDLLVCHNAGFDKLLAAHMLFVNGFKDEAEYFWNKRTYCTMLASTDVVKIQSPRGGYKWPKLLELYDFIFGLPFQNAHSAIGDVIATRDCYYKLIAIKEMDDVPF